MDLPIYTKIYPKRTEADKIQTAWSKFWYRPSEAEIVRAARLAWEGFLTSVEFLRMENISIRDIPREQMKKLASIVTDTVRINDLTHTDQLGSILASVNCPNLKLGYNMELGELETRALVSAMGVRLQKVDLQDVTFDIEELTKYDGQGICKVLVFVGDAMRTRHGDRLRRWAADIGWTVNGYCDSFVVKRHRDKNYFICDVC